MRSVVLADVGSGCRMRFSGEMGFVRLYGTFCSVSVPWLSRDHSSLRHPRQRASVQPERTSIVTAEVSQMFVVGRAVVSVEADYDLTLLADGRTCGVLSSEKMMISSP